MCVCAPVTEVVSPDLAAAVAPPVITSPISSTSANEGEPARFHCRVHGDGRTRCDSSWRKPRKDAASLMVLKVLSVL